MKKIAADHLMHAWSKLGNMVDRWVDCSRVPTIPCSAFMHYYYYSCMGSLESWICWCPRDCCSSDCGSTAECIRLRMYIHADPEPCFYKVYRVSLLDDSE